MTEEEVKKMMGDLEKLSQSKMKDAQLRKKEIIQEAIREAPRVIDKILNDALEKSHKFIEDRKKEAKQVSEIKIKRNRSLLEKEIIDEKQIRSLIEEIFKEVLK